MCVLGGCCRRHYVHIFKRSYDYHYPACTYYYYKTQWNRKKSSTCKSEVSCSSIINNYSSSSSKSQQFPLGSKIGFLYRRNLQLLNVPLSSSFNSSRNFHLSAVYFGDGPNKPSSKIEETVQALKEKAKEKETKEKEAKVKETLQSTVSSTAAPAVPPLDASKAEADKKDVVKASRFQMIRRKVVDEIVHYYHGFRLLFIDINVSRKLVWRLLNGHTLRRREKKLVSPHSIP